MAESTRPRVFVSSVMDGFTEDRSAARRGIERSGGEPILIEDYPGLPVSPRTACLDAVASSDIHLVIIGSRGGWTAPSGKLEVEEEYEEAQKRGLPIFVFLKTTNRDKDAARLSNDLSDYVRGRYRHTYDTPEELELLVHEAIRPLVMEMPEQSGGSMDALQDRFEEDARHLQGTHLRVVVAPQRDDEVFDSVQIGSKDFLRTVLEVGHMREVDLFDFSFSKSPSLDSRNDVLTIEQKTNGFVHKDVLVKIEPAGILDIRVSVSGRREGQGSGALSSMVIHQDDVKTAAVRCLKFSAALYERVDPYQRYARLKWNAAVYHRGSSPLVDELPQGSYTMPMRVPQPAVAFNAPRPITRQNLQNEESLVGELMTMLVRRFEA